LHVRGLRKRFAGVVAVDAVDIDLARGEICAIVGPDGAGKTTLLRMLCGVLMPDAGEAIVAGADVVHDPERVKAVIGYMPQRFSLYDDLSMLENLRFYADIYGVPPSEQSARAQRLLEEFDLAPFAGRLARQLSGGMKQKLALAATLIQQPQLLFLDEPTAGVDPVSRRQFWRILYALNRRGITIIVSTPYMDEAERATTVALMHRGRIVAFADPTAIKAAVPGQVVEIAVADRARAARVLRGLAQVRSLEFFGEALHALVPSAAEAVPALTEALHAAGIADAQLRAIPPSLEDAFVARLSEGAS